MYNGGVIYSRVKSLYLYISFNNCIFDNNFSHYQGNIIYIKVKNKKKKKKKKKKIFFVLYNI